MPNCPKCGKPVYFAERIVALGNEYHLQCLKCENCNTRLTPGQHSAHLKKLYCNGCYGNLFGPDGFRVGVLEPRKSKVIQVALPQAENHVPVGVQKRSPIVEQSETENMVPVGVLERRKPKPKMVQVMQSETDKHEMLTRIREYNLYKDSPVECLKTREVNGSVLFEGILRLYWGLKKPIILAPGALYAKQRYNRESIYDIFGMDDASYVMMLDEAAKVRNNRELSENERRRLKEIVQMSEEQRSEDLRDLTVSYSEGNSPLHSLPASRPGLHTSLSMIEEGNDLEHFNQPDGGYMSRSLDRRTSEYRSRSGTQVRKRSASFRKISKKRKEEAKSKDPEMTEPQLFTPPYGSSTNLRVSSNIQAQDVITMLLSKFKVENEVSHFALCIIHDNGVKEPCKDTDCPLMVRLKLGPSEDIARIFVLERTDVEKIDMTAEIGEWIKFAFPELELFCKKFQEEENREVEKIQKRFQSWREAIIQRRTEKEQEGKPYHETDL